MSTASLGSKLN